MLSDVQHLRVCSTMTSRNSRERKDTERYERLNRNTNELSSEYQLLRTETMSDIQRKLSANYLDVQKLKKEEIDRTKAALKKILITMIVVNITLVLLITVIAIEMAVFSYSWPIPGESTNNINLVKSEINDLVMNISHILVQLNEANSELATTLQNNVSQILCQLNALNRDILSVQEQGTWLQIQLYCGAGEWYRIAYLNMTDPSQQCPTDWREYNTSRVRACGRLTAAGGTCPATMYSVDRQYSKVCGRLIGYQIASPDGFTGGQTVDQMYIDGISITHGMPQRNHIWSYVAGVTERSGSQHRNNNCPCSIEPGTGPQSFLGDSYYCESGNPTDTYADNELFPDDPLWDGQQCEGTCCTGTNSPPWFSVQLPAPTTDTIEVRICADESTDNEDILIELLEIFVS